MKKLGSIELPKVEPQVILSVLEYNSMLGEIKHELEKIVNKIEKGERTYLGDINRLIQSIDEGKIG